MVKPSNSKPFGLLQALPPLVAVREELTMDFATHLPPSSEKFTILIVVNHLSKGTHFLPLKFPFTNLVDIAFSDGIICHHSIPKTLISDFDLIFLSSFWKSIFKAHRTKLLHTALPTIPIRMAKTRWWTGAANITYVASRWINQMTGRTTFNSSSCGIIPLNIPQLVQPHLNWPMGDLRCPWSLAWIVLWTMMMHLWHWRIRRRS